MQKVARTLLSFALAVDQAWHNNCPGERVIPFSQLAPSRCLRFPSQSDFAALLCGKNVTFFATKTSLPAAQIQCPWSHSAQIARQLHLTHESSVWLSAHLTIRQKPAHGFDYANGDGHVHDFLQEKKHSKSARILVYAGRYHSAQAWTISTRHFGRPACTESNRCMRVTSREEVFRWRRDKCVETDTELTATRTQPRKAAVWTKLTVFVSAACSAGLKKQENWSENTKSKSAEATRTMRPAAECWSQSWLQFPETPETLV